MMTDADEARRARDEAGAYHFTLRVPDHQFVSSTEAPATFPGVFGPDRVELRPEDARRLDEARRLFLSGQGYDAEDRAREAGERARRALLLAVLESGMGVEWGDDPGRGLAVWGGGLHAVGRSRSGASATATIGVGVEVLGERFARWLTRAPGLTRRQATAADLLSAVHFDASDRSRFLVAYAAIEELGAAPEALGLEPPRRSSAYLAALGRLVEHLGATEADPDPTVDRETKRELRDGLLGLQSVQGARRHRKMVEDVLNEEAAKRFDALARIRNRIAHKGLPPPAGGSPSYDAYHLALDLLFGTIARQGPQTQDGRCTPGDDPPLEAS